MKKRSRIEYSTINMVVSLGGYIFNILLSFICRIIFVRLLSAEYLGVNGLFSNILSMLSLTELGIGTAMVYALYKPVACNDKKKISAIMKVYKKAYFIIGIAVALFGLVICPFLKYIIKEQPNIQENIYLLYLLYLFSMASGYFFSYKGSILIAHQRNYVVTAISYIIVILQNVAQIIALLFTHNYLLYLVLQVFFSLLTNIVIALKASKDYPYLDDYPDEKLSKDEMYSIIRNVKALTVTKLSGLLVNNTDNIVITFFNGIITTGVVSNYTLLSGILNSFVNQIFASITSSVGNLNAQESEERKYAVFCSLNLANFWVYGWAAIGIAVLSGDIVAVLFGNEYVINNSVPIILAINFYMLGMQCVVGMFKSTMGLFRYGQYALLFTAVLNLIGDFVLGKTMGLLGIFIATAIARLVTNTWYEPYVVFKHGFHKKFTSYITRYLLYAVMLTISGGLCFALCSLIKFSAWVTLILKICICIVVPNIVFIAAFYRKEEFSFFLALLKRFLDKFLRKKRK
ncbi:MAG: oligosaccharide flippase family protein [Eubacteriales bacterium]|nr:oligosaccharide flippase family protein [Eubacteriales bacterium]